MSKTAENLHHKDAIIKESKSESYAVDGNCIGCGICAGVSPMVFRMDEQGKADTDEDPSADRDPVGAAQAMAICPVGAIGKK